jgi:hypothetical protein
MVRIIGTIIVNNYKQMKHKDRLLSTSKWNKVFVNTALYQDYLSVLDMMDGKPLEVNISKLKISHTIYPNGEVTWNK